MKGAKNYHQAESLYQIFFFISIPFSTGRKKYGKSDISYYLIDKSFREIISVETLYGRTFSNYNKASKTHSRGGS
jgi:hypothetical protein